ncbi:hypothetical protein LXL04_037827 [Taraxacum kok-saghyz]
MLLSIRVETEFAEERTEDHGTTSSQPRRSDRGGFSLRPSDMRVYGTLADMTRPGESDMRVYVTLADMTPDA